MRATIKNINDAIAENYPGEKIEFVKGNGYFYFISESLNEIDSIYVYALHHMPLEKWTEFAFDHIDDAIAERDERIALDAAEPRDAGMNGSSPVMVIRSHDFTEDGQQTVLDRVKAYAKENYTNGWDRIVECYTDAELAEDIGTKTFEQYCELIERVNDARSENQPMEGWDY